MELLPEHAREALREVDRTARQARERAAYCIAGPIMTLWGAIWIVCSCIAHFLPWWGGWAWLSGVASGIAGSIWLGWIRGRRWPTRSRQAGRELNRLGMFWIALFAYGFLWLVLGRSWPGEAFFVYVVTLVMFAYVAMGLFLEAPFLLGVGLVVTVLAAGGFFVAGWWLPNLMGYLHLWIGITGGGTLLLAGIRYWRRASGDE